MLERARAGIPDDIAGKSRLHIADTVGISLAAVRADPLAAQVLEAFRYGSGGGDCTIFGGSERLPPQAASFCNSALAHLLDFDDIYDAGRVHLTAVTLPAALASSQMLPRGHGDIVAGVSLGNELICRLGAMYLATGRGAGSDWFLTQLFGYFGAALAAGIVLRLSEDAIVSSFGFAYMQAAGGKEAALGAGSNARGIYPAFAAAGGLGAALLARAGLRGPESALDGNANLFKNYLGGEPPPSALETLLDPAAWLVGDVDIKLWPSCRLSHPYVAAALAIHRELDDAPIERIVAAVNRSAAKLCEPLERRRRPVTLQDAKYSIPFMIAFALSRGRVDLHTLDDSALDDSTILEVASRVVVEESLPDCPGQPPAEITVHTARGVHKRSSREKAPVGEAMVKEKFIACVAHAGWRDEAEKLWRRLLDVDEELCELLSGIRCHAATAGASAIAQLHS